MKRRVQRLFRKFKKQKSENNWNNYKNARNEYQHNLNNAESDYRKSLSVSLATCKNTKKWWNTAKWLLGKGGDTSYPTININDNQITDSRDKAYEFNKFFLSHSDLDDSNAVLPLEDNFEGSPPKCSKSLRHNFTGHGINQFISNVLYQYF